MFRNAEIRLELNGLSSLMNGELVYVILHSNVPVRWLPYDASDHDCSVDITFVVSAKILCFFLLKSFSLALPSVTYLII